METRYTSIVDLEESLRRLVPKLEKCRLEVVRVPHQFKVVGDTRKEMKQRNILDIAETGPSIIWERDGTISSPLITMQVVFHENELEKEFMFRSSGNRYTPMGALSETLAEIEEVFTEDLDLATFDFAEIDSASMSGGLFDGLADREFTYEQIFEKAAFE